MRPTYVDFSSDVNHLLLNCRAISGKSDRDTKHRDSIIIKEARMAPPPPPPPSSSKKPALAAMGFATVEDA